MQPCHVVGEADGTLAVQPVGDEKDDRALRQHAAGPEPVELAERLADAGAARPVRHRAGDLLERLFRVAPGELAGDVGQPCAEEEGGHAVALVGDGMEEVQQDLRVAGHRAGNVAQDDERRRAGERHAAGDVEHLAGMAHRIAQGALEIDPAAAGGEAEAAGAPFVEREGEAGDLGLGGRNFLGAHRLEIEGFEAFLARGGEQRVDLAAFVGAGFLLARLGRLHRLGKAAGAGGGLFLARGAPIHRRQHLGEFGGVGVAPEDREGLVEQQRVLVPAQHHRL